MWNGGENIISSLGVCYRWGLGASLGARSELARWGLFEGKTAKKDLKILARPIRFPGITTN